VTPGPDALEALLEVLALKALPRAGWVRVGVSAPESVAGHTWGVAWLVLALRPAAPADLDLARALTYAVLHDLPEVRTGDLTPHDGVAPADKRAAEQVAMAGLCAGLPGGEALAAAWEAYEAQADPEARWVRQLDRLDMALQAVAYAEGGEGAEHERFLDSAARVIVDPPLVALLGALRDRISRISRAGAGSGSSADRGR
jgi:putative hydrolases of HD superfamily